MKQACGFLALSTVMTLTGLAGAGPLTAKQPPVARPRDAYVLSRGSDTSMSGSMEDLEALRRRFEGDFLWLRRSGKQYVIRDARLLAEALGLFDGIGALDPERKALARREALLDREDEALDRDEEALEAEQDSPNDVSAPDEPDEAYEGDASDATDDDRGAVETTDETLSARRACLDERRRDLSSRQRALDVEDRALDRREEALEQAAEKQLWSLLDRAIGSGAAARARWDANPGPVQLARDGLRAARGARAPETAAESRSKKRRGQRFPSPA